MIADQRKELTRCAVKVSDAEDISRTAHSRAVGACAESHCTLTVQQGTLSWDGSSQSGGCASKGKDGGGEMHVDFGVEEGKICLEDWLCKVG